MHSKFKKNDKFVSIVAGCKRYGVVSYFRDDLYEQKNSWPKGFFYYSVTFDDGTFETYLNETYMKPMVKDD